MTYHLCDYNETTAWVRCHHQLLRRLGLCSPRFNNGHQRQAWEQNDLWAALTKQYPFFKSLACWVNVLGFIWISKEGLHSVKMDRKRGHHI